MRLGDLIDGLGLSLSRGGGEVEVTEITDDSRRATPGCVYIARDVPGPDGLARAQDYIAAAVANGAVAVIAGAAHAPLATGADVAWASAAKVDQRLAGQLAERFFGEPSAKLKLLGITGTNGKTTTAFILQHLLRQAGVATGLMGTVLVDDGRERRPAELTTPGAIDFSRNLAAMVANGCRAAVAEVSSHALHQGRVAALRFDVGVFTNLTGDHLDYHGTMEDYAAAKAVLFASLPAEGYAVVNADDAWTPRLLEGCVAKVLSCSVSSEGHAPPKGEASACHATILRMEADRLRGVFDGPWGSVEVDLPLVGRHNAINALQAAAAGNTITALARTLRNGLASCPGVPGRLEAVRLEAGQLDAAGVTSDSASAAPVTGMPTVIVDYAHTHDALENALLALRPVTRGRLIVLFGAGGDRDRTKRPKMAAVACKLADRVIITSDNPRTEDPQAIIDEILSGVPAQTAANKVHVQSQRDAAIALAISEAGPLDVVLLAGKGHEDYQIIGTTKHPFDDRVHALAALDRRAGRLGRSVK